MMRRSYRLALGVVLFQYLLSVAPAGVLYWDGDGTAPLGGSGTWNTTDLDWWNGTAYEAWDNAAENDAVFDTVGGNVTIVPLGTIHNLLEIIPSAVVLQSMSDDIISSDEVETAHLNIPRCSRAA